MLYIAKYDAQRIDESSPKEKLLRKVLRAALIVIELPAGLLSLCVGLLLAPGLGPQPLEWRRDIVSVSRTIAIGCLMVGVPMVVSALRTLGGRPVIVTRHLGLIVLWLLTSAFLFALAVGI